MTSLIGPLLLVAALAAAAPVAPPPGPGDRAPGFSLVGSDGARHALEDHLGKRAVVIAWFPKIFTGG